MTKAELIEQMANDAGITKVAATQALESMINGIYCIDCWKKNKPKAHNLDKPNNS